MSSSCEHTDCYRAGKRLWSADDDARFRRLYPDTPTTALAKQLRRSRGSLYARAKLLGVEKSEAYRAGPHACRLRRGDHIGAQYRFTPGHAPANKGLRRPGWAAGRMRETQFKRGARQGMAARRWMPVGSTRLCDGYVYRKVSDVVAVPWTRNWKQEHILVWEQAHGPIPPKHALTFRNGNRMDIRLDNLEVITRRELMARNSVHTLPTPLAHAVQLLGALHRQIRRKARVEEEQDRRPARSPVRDARSAQG